MEQRQPDEPNEPRIDPSPKQLSDSQNTTQRIDTPPATDQPPTGEQQTIQQEQGAAQRDAAGQNPNQRNNRQQNSRPNGGQRDNGPRNGGPRPNEPRNGGQQNGRNNGGQRNGGGPRAAEPGNSDLEPTQQTEQNSAPRGDAPRGDAPRNDSRRNNRNEGRPTGRDRSPDTRERDQMPRNPDSRPRAGMPDQRDMDGDADDQTGQTTEFQGRDERLVIGISLGDYNGIGPEVILKALQYNRLQKLCTPVIYGSVRILNRYRNLLDMKDWNLNGVPGIGQISHKLTNVITCWPDQNQDIQPGQVTPEAGQAALACLQRAVDDLKDGKLDALVTAPINKYNIQSEEFQFPGHTEYLAQQFDVADNLMFMVSDTLRVGVVTGHVPLGRVRQNVTRERIAQKLSLMMQSLKQDFGIEKPKIAVLGLNPHAGEEGLLGNEEQDIIKPLLTDLRNKGQLVFGPYPADGFFGTRNYRNFDAVLAMYHDQGLIPFKAIAFEEGVNFTAGMPVVRTSPDHGTAYDIAGKDLADETSMLQAIYTAIDIARQRKEFMELEAGALRKVVKS